MEYYSIFDVFYQSVALFWANCMDIINTANGNQHSCKFTSGLGQLIVFVYKIRGLSPCRGEKAQ